MAGFLSHLWGWPVLTGCCANTCHHTRYQTQTFIPGGDAAQGANQRPVGPRVANQKPGRSDHIRKVKYLASLLSCRERPWELVTPRNKSSLASYIQHSISILSEHLNSPCIVRKVLRHVEVHGHVVAVVRVAPNPFTLHHLSSPRNHFTMQSLMG